MTNPKARAFLKALARTGNISAAAKMAKVARRSHDNWLKIIPEYRRAFVEAMDRAADRLEREALRRAAEGLRRFKFHQGLPIMIACDKDHPEAVLVTKPDGSQGHVRHYYEHEYSDTLLIFLLKAVRPEKFRERYEVKHEGKGAGPQEVVVRFEDRGTNRNKGREGALRQARNGNGNGANGNGS